MLKNTIVDTRLVKRYHISFDEYVLLAFYIDNKLKNAMYSDIESHRQYSKEQVNKMLLKLLDRNIITYLSITLTWVSFTINPKYVKKYLFSMKRYSEQYGGKYN